MSEHRLCAVSEIEEEESRGFEIQDGEKKLSLLVVKKDGILSVYVNKCPHLGVPLNFEDDRFLDVEKNFILCSTHGALFKIDDGECVHGPCLGASLKPQPFEIRDEELFVSNGL